MLVLVVLNKDIINEYGLSLITNTICYKQRHTSKNNLLNKNNQ